MRSEGGRLLRQGEGVAEEGLLAAAAEIELEGHVHLAHQFFLGAFFALGQETFHFRAGIIQEFLGTDLQGIGCGVDLHFRHIPELALFEGASAAIAKMRDHKGTVLRCRWWNRQAST